MSYLLQYGELPSKQELERWDEALRRHSALPVFVENAVAALPHDAHFMGTILTAINALSTGHPEQNPALAGQDIYKSKEIQDKQIVRLIGESLPLHDLLCLLLQTSLNNWKFKVSVGICPGIQWYKEDCTKCSELQTCKQHV